MPLSLSTHWNAHRHRSGEEMIDDILALGLGHVELGYNLTLDLLPGVKRRSDEKAIRVRSVHNFCPVPVWAPGGHPELFLLSSDDRQQRERAVTYTLKTVDLAEEIGATVVVAHPGRLPIKHLTLNLIALAEKGDQAGKRYDKIRNKMIVQREKKIRPALDNLYRALEQLLPHLERARVKLALENLPSWEAIPGESEMVDLLAHFDSPFLGYWHDIGHGQVRQNLGFAPQLHWLERLQRYQAGWHVHDVHPPAQDHLMPPRGTIDFQAFKPFVQSDSLLVLEPAPGVPAEQIQEGAKFLNEVWELE